VWWRAPAQLAAAVALMLVLLFGLVPSPLDPLDPRRLRGGDGPALVEMLERIRDGRAGRNEQDCAEALAGEGHPWRVPVYGLDLVVVGR
jgi:hypothetical protein